MKKNSKLPRDVNVEEPIFRIVSASVDDHKSQRAQMRTDLKYFAIKEFEVINVGIDESDESTRVFRARDDKGIVFTFTAPKMGYNGVYPETAIFSDKDEAKIVAIAQNLAYYDQALKDLEDAKGRVNLFEDILKIYDASLECIKNRPKEATFVNKRVNLSEVRDDNGEAVVLEVAREKNAPYSGTDENESIS